MTVLIASSTIFFVSLIPALAFSAYVLYDDRKHSH